MGKTNFWVKLNQIWDWMSWGWTWHWVMTILAKKIENFVPHPLIKPSISVWLPIPPVSPILSMTGHQTVLGQWALDQTIITTYAGVTQPCSFSNPTQFSKAEIVWLEYQQVPFWVHFYVSFTKEQSCFNHLQSSSVSFVCFVWLVSHPCYSITREPTEVSNED